MKFEGFSTENKHISKILATTAETVTEDIMKNKRERMLCCGASMAESYILPVYFAALVGFPQEGNEADFNNALFNFRENLIASPKLLIYLNSNLMLPKNDEMTAFNGVRRENSSDMTEDFKALINISGDAARTDEARRVFEELSQPISESSADELFAYGARMITWLNRCTSSKEYYDSCTIEIPTIICYGNVGRNEIMFLHFMSRIGIDVILIDTDKSVLPLLGAENIEKRMQIFELAETKSVYPYPDKITKIKKATVAYKAEKELDTLLYGGDIMFRDFQFQKMRSLTLKTTFEEIDVLWHQAAKFRPGFEISGGDTAVIPNIFAKISGVDGNNMDDYWDMVREKLSPFTVVVNKSPDCSFYTTNQLNAYRQFFNGTVIDKEKLRKSPLNKYSFLSDSIQELIFDKMQEAVDSGLLKIDENELITLVIHVGLNIDRAVLKLLQKFDFTKDIPKFVVTDVIEDTFSKVECIQLLLYNLLGFDIIIYTPTGYRDIEAFLDDNAFETYTLPDFKYDARVPRFKIPDKIPEPKKEGFFDKLFKKGRK